MTYPNKVRNLTVIAVLAAACALSACGGSDSGNPTPSDGTGGKKGTGGSKAKDAGTSGDSGTGGKSGTGGMGAAGDKAAAGKSGTSGAGGAAGSAGGSGSGACDKDSAKGCYTCDKPANDDEFLNHCTGATCSAYDNSKLTKLGANGKLPDLP